jgi:DNA polymerase I
MASRNLSSKTLLVDGDLVAHKIASALQEEIDWGDDISSLHCNVEHIKLTFDAAIDNYAKAAKAPRAEVIIAFTGYTNFRKDLYPDYKANRSSRKPVGYRAAKEWILSEYNCKAVESLEADDVLGIMATCGKYKNPIIVSDDKDLLQIPCRVFSPNKGKTTTVTKEDGYRTHMIQTLTGDRTDNYPGCPGVGEITAAKVLDGLMLEDMWPAVVGLFEAKGFTEEDALLQARLAKILQTEDFDRKKRKVKLWKK